MGTLTDELKAYKPAFNEQGWDDEVSANFDLFDTAIAPFTTTLYVRPTGDNTNAGTSWAVAKADILGAFDALPAGGGRTLFETGSYVDAAHTDRGFWFLGANDSNYGGALPTGWRRGNGTLIIEGVPSVHAGGSRRATAYLLGGSPTDTAKPLFWFSGCQNSIELRNVASNTELARPMELGKDSGTGLATNNSGFVFDNLLLSANTGNAAHGPCINATSVYWLYGRDLTLSGNGAAAKTTTNRGAFVLSGSSQGHGLIWIRDTNFNQGAGFIQQATSGGITTRLENIVQESPPAGDAQALFWLHSRVDSANTAGAAQIIACEQADQSLTLSDPLVKVDPGNSPSLVVVHGAAVVDGPCTLIGGAVQASLATSPTSMQAQGVFGRRIIGLHDAHRRSFSFSTVRFANLASQDATAWSSLVGSATVTTGKADPAGGVNAAELSGASQLYRRFTNASRSVAVGDWVIAGVWMRSVAGVWPSAMPEVDWSASDDLFDSTAAGVNFFTLDAPFKASTKEWVFVSRAQKVIQASSSPATLIFSGFCSSGASMQYFAPVVLHIATGSVDDAEVLAIAENLAAWPDTASAGQLAVMRDQPVHIPRSYIEMGEMTAPAAGATNYGRLYMEDNGAGKTRLVVKFPTGAAQVIATEP